MSEQKKIESREVPRIPQDNHLQKHFLLSRHFVCLFVFISFLFSVLKLRSDANPLRRSCVAVDCKRTGGRTRRRRSYDGRVLPLEVRFLLPACATLLCCRAVDLRTFQCGVCAVYLARGDEGEGKREEREEGGGRRRTGREEREEGGEGGEEERETEGRR